MGRERADVLIVGGGPAGLAAAIALRQRGATVTVADAMKPPIEKTCGEGMMPDSLHELAMLGVDLSDAGGAEFYGIRFVDEETGKAVASAFPFGRGIGLSRPRLHRLMVERALEAGVSLRWQTHVQLREDSSVLVGGEPAAYGCLAGADGQSSKVRRWAGLEACNVMGRRFGFRQHFAVRQWSPYVEVYWGRNGQAYVAPVAPDVVCVVGMSRDPHMRIEQLLLELPSLAEKLTGADGARTAVNCERGGLMTTRRFRHVAKGRVALVGDASGSVDAITGEGLALGFRQALLLADCLAAGDVEAGLARYDRLHPRTLKVPHTMGRAMLLMDRWPMLRSRAMRMLANDPSLFARMLGVHVGSEPLLGFVAARGPRLAWRLAVPRHAA